MSRQTKQQREIRFDDKLILYKFCQAELGITDFKSLARRMNDPSEEGINIDTGNTKFLDHLLHNPTCKIPEDKLRLYDENINRYTNQIGAKRGGITWKYFQYIALLFTEIYLDRYFSDKEALCKDLTDFLRSEDESSFFQIGFDDFDVARLNKLAFMCATGSGKTLLLHVNILQYMHYMKAAKRRDSRIGINRIIVLTPNEGMSRQHLEELTLSGINAEIFQKDGGFKSHGNTINVTIIDINKLEEEGKDKTVSVDSFERNNLLMVDEGHRGLSGGGKVWFDYRKRIAEDGFTFEYSATFKQALNVNSAKKEDRQLVEEYGKSIIMDYSYKYFYNDGYGKDYRIFNLKDYGQNYEIRPLYLTGCLLSFYQQKKCFIELYQQIKPFNIEDPLLVFVGNRVTATTSVDELTDVEDVIMFLDNFVRNRNVTINLLKKVTSQNTGLIDAKGRDIFSHDFTPLYDMNGGKMPDAEELYEDILRIVFNSTTNAYEPRLHLDNIKQAGEIALKIGEDGYYFGVINIGETSKLMKSCEEKGVVVKQDAFISESLFADINRKGSKVNILIGSRKFTEGWNSWRVSTIGLINFAKGEGSQAIQMFGRGVRLRGYKGCLKRSEALPTSMYAPKVKHINRLETLTLFGVRANYMEDFKKFLEMEDVKPNEDIVELNIPTVSRYKEAKPNKLRVIRVKEGKNFKKDAERKLLGVPDVSFENYLVKNKVVIDCRSKIQTIDSTLTLRIEDALPVYKMPFKNIDVLDYQRIYDELEEYKNEKQYFNISIKRDNLMPILKCRSWYEFIIPENQLEIDSMAKLENMTDFAIIALKVYMDKFFKFKKEEWEDKYLEYAELEEYDNNFIDEYEVKYSEESDVEGYRDELEKFIKDASDILIKNGGLDEYKLEALQGKMVLFDFRHHLYAPLVCVRKSNLKIQVSPVSLNEDEKRFVDYLNDWVVRKGQLLQDKSLFLLRNKSKVGMGFFEAGNFYPDYILWIDTAEVQYISFIDPKGLLHVPPHDPKITFYKKIKELEERLQPTSGDKRIVLNSFIMSGTKSEDLTQRWNLNRDKRESMNVYTLDDDSCVDKMMDKILFSRDYDVSVDDHEMVCAAEQHGYTKEDIKQFITRALDKCSDIRNRYLGFDSKLPNKKIELASFQSCDSYCYSITDSDVVRQMNFVIRNYMTNVSTTLICDKLININDIQEELDKIKSTNKYDEQDIETLKSLTKEQAILKYVAVLSSEFNGTANQHKLLWNTIINEGNKIKHSEGRCKNNKTLFDVVYGKGKSFNSRVVHAVIGMMAKNGKYKGGIKKLSQLLNDDPVTRTIYHDMQKTLYEFNFDEELITNLTLLME